jgi:hypothetical protein
VLERLGLEQLPQRREEVRLRQVDALLMAGAHAAQQLAPRHAGALLVGHADRHRVPDRLRVAQHHAAHGGLRQARLEVHDDGRVVGSLLGLLAQQREHRRDVAHVVLTQALAALVVAQVVVAIGQAEAALAGPQDHLRRVVGGLVRRQVEQRRQALQGLVRDHRAQLGLAGAGVDAADEVRDGQQALLLDRRRVHAGAPEVAQQLVHAAARRVLLLCRRLQDLAQQALVAVGDLVPGAPAAVLGRHRVVLHPAAVDEGVDVRARVHAAVEVGRVEADQRGQRRQRVAALDGIARAHQRRGAGQEQDRSGTRQRRAHGGLRGRDGAADSRKGASRCATAGTAGPSEGACGGPSPPQTRRASAPNGRSRRWG